MDSIFKIKRSCYRPSEFKPGCLFAFTPTSPFIRLYLGKNSQGYHLFRLIRSHDRDVNSGIEALSHIFSPYIVVHRKRSIPYGY